MRPSTKLKRSTYKILGFKRKATARDTQRHRRNVVDDLLHQKKVYQNSPEAKKLEKQLRREQEKEVRGYAKLIPDLLANQRAASVHKVIKNGHERRRFNKVRILSPLYIMKDFYMLKVDTTHLPHGVSVAMLSSESVMRSLRAGLEVPIEYRETDSYGFWYIIPRTGLARIPNKINYHDVIALLPKSASSWTVCLGVTDNKKLIKLDFRDKPHLLIAGTTGSGKTVFLKNLILTLALNNSPERLRFVIADFKGGADFVTFEDLPHLGASSVVSVLDEKITDITAEGESIIKKDEYFADEIINDTGELETILKWAAREITKRNGLFAKLQKKGIHITNIREYNAKYRRKPMPRIILLIDEFAQAMYDGNKNKLKKQIGSIARLGRSAGIHLVLGTQSAEKNILEGPIAQNIGTRMAGFSTGPNSQTIIGSWLANRIANEPGRMAYRSHLDEYEIQTPWVSPKLASKMLDDIKTKWATNPDEDPISIKLFKYALEHRGGDYEAEIIHQFFKDDDDISRTVAREIGQEYELSPDNQKEIIINDNAYYLLPAIPGRRTRKLILKSTYQAQNANTTPTPPINQNETDFDLNTILNPEYPDPKTPTDLFLYAITHLNHKLAIRKLHAHFKAFLVSEAKIRDVLATFDLKPNIIINNQSYTIKPVIGKKSRLLVPQNKSQTMLPQSATVVNLSPTVVTPHSPPLTTVNTTESQSLLEPNIPPKTSQNKPKTGQTVVTPHSPTPHATNQSDPPDVLEKPKSNPAFDLSFLDDEPDTIAVESDPTPPKPKQKNLVPLGALVDAKTNKQWQKFKKNKKITTDSEAILALLEAQEQE